jgi:hypothetical protein
LRHPAGPMRARRPDRLRSRDTTRPCPAWRRTPPFAIHVRLARMATSVAFPKRRFWPTFRELAEERGGLPGFVTREFDEYLRLCCERGGHAMGPRLNVHAHTRPRRRQFGGSASPLVPFHKRVRIDIG